MGCNLAHRGGCSLQTSDCGGLQAWLIGVAGKHAVMHRDIEIYSENNNFCVVSSFATQKHCAVGFFFGYQTVA